MACLSCTAARTHEAAQRQDVPGNRCELRWRGPIVLLFPLDLLFAKNAQWRQREKSLVKLIPLLVDMLQDESSADIDCWRAAKATMLKTQTVKRRRPEKCVVSWKRLVYTERVAAWHKWWLTQLAQLHRGYSRYVSLLWWQMGEVRKWYLPWGLFSKSLSICRRI